MEDVRSQVKQHRDERWIRGGKKRLEKGVKLTKKEERALNKIKCK